MDEDKVFNENVETVFEGIEESPLLVRISFCVLVIFRPSKLTKEWRKQFIT